VFRFCGRAVSTQKRVVFPQVLADYLFCKNRESKRFGF
jgi:hypothetical protein